MFESYVANLTCQNGLKASMTHCTTGFHTASPLKMVVKSNTELLLVARAASSLCRWSKGQLCLSSGWSYCARRSACCLCAPEVTMKAAPKERNRKTHVSPDASRQPWPRASLSITKDYWKHFWTKRKIPNLCLAFCAFLTSSSREMKWKRLSCFCT